MKGKAVRIKLTANRQTGANGVRAHPLAKCICGSEGQGPAPQAQRSYYWCCYAAIIGAAPQLFLVLLPRDQQGGIQILKMCVPRRISRAVRLRRSAGIIGAATQLSLVLLRSYHWCGYAAIIGAATQLSLVRLRSYYYVQPFSF